MAALERATAYPGGRFAFTVEEGGPLTQQERARMPGPDTVWLLELAELTGVLREAGLTVIWRGEYSFSHRAIAMALLRCYRACASSRWWRRSNELL